VVPAARAVPVPAGVDDETAAAVLLQGMTAQYLTNTTYPVQPGDTVLVHAAAGGTGSLAVQLAKEFGAGRVIATASAKDKRDLALELGADLVGGNDRAKVAADDDLGHLDGVALDLDLDRVGGHRVEADAYPGRHGVAHADYANRGGHGPVIALCPLTGVPRVPTVSMEMRRVATAFLLMMATVLAARAQVMQQRANGRAARRSSAIGRPHRSQAP